MNNLLFFQAVKGLRRQFLMTPDRKIIVLLKRGEKVDSCNNVFRDVTEHVKCKVDQLLSQQRLLSNKMSSTSLCPESWR